jgi:hypothetical protein
MLFTLIIAESYPNLHAGLKVHSLLLFPQPINASRSINNLLHLRNVATLTLVERECSLESAEQAGLRRRSTVQQQKRGSRRQFFPKYVRIFLMTTGSSMKAMTFAIPLQIRHVSTSISLKAPTVGENPLQPLRSGQWPHDAEQRLLVMAICDFGIAILAPLPRYH